MHDWRVFCAGDLSFCIGRLRRLLEFYPARYRLVYRGGEWVVEVFLESFDLDWAVLDALAADDNPGC